MIALDLPFVFEPALPDMLPVVFPHKALAHVVDALDTMTSVEETTRRIDDLLDAADLHTFDFNRLIVRVARMPLAELEDRREVIAKVLADRKRKDADAKAESDARRAYFTWYFSPHDTREPAHLEPTPSLAAELAQASAAKMLASIAASAGSAAEATAAASYWSMELADNAEASRKARKASRVVGRGVREEREEREEPRKRSRKQIQHGFTVGGIAYVQGELCMRCYRAVASMHIEPRIACACKKH